MIKSSYAKVQKFFNLLQFLASFLMASLTSSASTARSSSCVSSSVISDSCTVYWVTMTLGLKGNTFSWPVTSKAVDGVVITGIFLT